MTIESVRKICQAFPAVTEDVKWGHDLCFCVAGKMFAAMDLNPPHSLGFKCTPDEFAELVERPGIVPAPYMARNMWVLEERLGEALERRELERLLKTSYDLVVARLPKSRRPGAPAVSRARRASPKRSRARRRR
jgi:predicted DNA-binding protein (MmcQ/YjbR family)